MTSGGVQHKQDFLNRSELFDDAADFAQLIHEVTLVLQAAGGVDDEHVSLVVERFLSGVVGNRCWVCAILVGAHHFDARLCGPGGKLVGCCCSEGVGGGENDVAAFSDEEAAELACGCGLAGTVDADHDDDVQRAGLFSRSGLLGGCWLGGCFWLRFTVFLRLGDSFWLVVAQCFETAVSVAAHGVQQSFAQHVAHFLCRASTLRARILAQFIDDFFGSFRTHIGQEQGVLNVFPIFLAQVVTREDGEQGFSKRISRMRELGAQANEPAL